MKFFRLDHALADSFTRLLNLLDNGGVVKDSTGHLTMAASQPEHQVKRGFLLNVVIAQRASIFELLARKNEALLIGWNAFLVLNLLLDCIDTITGFDIERNGLAGKSLDENLGRKRVVASRLRNESGRERQTDSKSKFNVSQEKYNDSSRHEDHKTFLTTEFVTAAAGFKERWKVDVARRNATRPSTKPANTSKTISTWRSCRLTCMVCSD